MPVGELAGFFGPSLAQVGSSALQRPPRTDVATSAGTAFSEISAPFVLGGGSAVQPVSAASYQSPIFGNTGFLNPQQPSNNLIPVLLIVGAAALVVILMTRKK